MSDNFIELSYKAECSCGTCRRSLILNVGGVIFEKKYSRANADLPSATQGDEDNLSVLRVLKSLGLSEEK